MSHVAIYFLRQFKKNASEKFGYVKFEYFLKFNLYVYLNLLIYVSCMRNYTVKNTAKNTSVLNTIFPQMRKINKYTWRVFIGKKIDNPLKKGIFHGIFNTVAE